MPLVSEIEILYPPTTDADQVETITRAGHLYVTLSAVWTAQGLSVVYVRLETLAQMLPWDPWESMMEPP